MSACAVPGAWGVTSEAGIPGVAGVPGAWGVTSEAGIPGVPGVLDPWGVTGEVSITRVAAVTPAAGAAGEPGLTRGMVVSGVIGGLGAAVTTSVASGAAWAEGDGSSPPGRVGEWQALWASPLTPGSSGAEWSVKASRE